MAIYKLFPYKDATLYSFYPNMNTGIDPITTISNLKKQRKNIFYPFLYKRKKERERERKRCDGMQYIYIYIL